MSWTAATVGEIAEQIRGVSYDKSEILSEPATGFLPVLRANNVTEDGLYLDDFVYVPETRISPKQKLQLHDVVVTASSGSIDVVGRTASIDRDFQGSFGAFCKVLRPSDRVDPRFFAHFFKTTDYRRTISSLAAGANINNLKNEHLDDLVIHLPSLAEQKRIAAILDAAEALRAKRRTALAKLDQLARSIFIEMFGDPNFNHRKLSKVPLGDLIKVKSGENLVAADMASSGQYPVYGGNGVNGYHDAFMFEERKVCIGRVGVYCGAVHLTEPKAWITDNALYVSDMSDRLERDYLIAALRFANLNQYAGRAAQPLVSGSRIYPVEVLVPPIQHQVAFSAAITSSVSVRDKLVKATNSLLTLFSSLQNRAFKGEL